MFEEKVDARQMIGEGICINFYPNMTLVLNDISGSQSGEHEGYGLLGCDIVKSGRYVLKVCWGKLLPLSLR
jgi:hypothetical protein